MRSERRGIGPTPVPPEGLAEAMEKRGRPAQMPKEL